VRVRSDTIHLFPVALASIVVAAGLLSFALSRPARAARGVGLVFGLAMIVLLGGLARDRIASHGPFDWAIPAPSVIEKAGTARVGQDLVDLVSFIQANTAQADAIYVGVTNHDRFLINDVLVYFLAGRAYATRYHELHPGVTTTRSVQQEIVDELERAPVRLIVLRDGYWYEPNQTEIDAGIELLDRYIAANYRLVQRAGGYEVWSGKP